MRTKLSITLISAFLLLAGTMIVSGWNDPQAGYTTIGDDADNDGVPDSVDVCNGEDASFFDRDGDGCLDELLGTRHTEYWDLVDMPFTYYISQNGAPGITDGSDFSEIQNAVAAWVAVSGTDITVNYAGTTAQTDAAGMDGVNLVTFEDTDYAFGPFVLAVGVTYSFTEATIHNSRVYRAGQIVDADMIFNASQNFKTQTQGSLGSNIQSVATHEAGHLFGIAHSAVESSTMFFVLPGGLAANTLETEDETVLLKGYGDSATVANGNRLGGTVTDGSTTDPVPGAIVFAIDTTSGDTLGCEYTMPDGSYLFFGLPDGDYYISVHALDGTSPVGGLVPGYVNDLIDTTAVILFPPEYWNSGDSQSDDPTVHDPITLSGGATVTNIDIVTNVDLSGPTVAQATPAEGDTVRVDEVILLKFSESINTSTLGTNFSVRKQSTGEFITGIAQILYDDSLVAFTPTVPYNYETAYVCSVKAGLEDAYGNPMGTDFVIHFDTEEEPPISIASLVPNKGIVGSIVVVNGSGFDINPSGNMVLFAAAAGTTVTATVQRASPSRLVMVVPPEAVTGELKVVTGPDTSSGITFTLLSQAEVARGYLAGVSTLGAKPHSLTVLPDGKYAYVATDDGASAVVVDPGKAGYLNATSISIAGGLSDIDGTPDGKRIYGVSRTDSSLHVISSDPSEPLLFNKEINTIYTRDEPLGIKIEPSGRKAYVATLGGRIQVWDVRQGSMTLWQQIGEIIPPYTDLRGKMAVDPAGERLLALSGTGRLLIFHVGPDTLLDEVSIGLDPRDVVVDPVGQRAYVSDGSGAIAVVSLGAFGDTPFFVQNISDPGSLRGLDISPAGLFLYSADRLTDYVDVVDLGESSSTFRTVIANIEAGNNPVDVELSPDGYYAFSLVEDGSQLVATTIGFGPIIKSISPMAAPEGAKLVIAGEGFGFSPDNVDVIFTGRFGSTIVVPPDSLALWPTDLTVTVPHGAVSGPIRLAVSPSDVIGPPQYSNELYFRSLGTSGDTGMRLAAELRGQGTFRYRAKAVISPMGDQMVRAESNVGRMFFTDIDPDSPTLHQILTIFQIPDVILPNPMDMAFTPDGKRMYVAEREGGGIYEFDSNRHSASYGELLGKVNDSLANLDRPFDVEVSPSGELCVVVDETSWAKIIDITEGPLDYNSVIDTVEIRGTFMDMEFHPGGRYLYIADDSLNALRVMSVDRYDIVPGRFVATLPLLTGIPSPEYPEPVVVSPVSIAFTPDGSKCYISGYVEGVLDWRVIFYVSTTDPSNPSLVIGGNYTFYSTSTNYDEFLDVSPQGNRLVYHASDPQRGLIYFSLDSTIAELQTIPGPGSVVDLHFTPDGTRLYGATASPDTLPTKIYDFYGVEAPLEMLYVSGNGQLGIINEKLPVPLRVRVLDGISLPATGAPVTFTVLSGGGHFEGSGNATQVDLTDSDGYAEVGWVLGSVVGSQQVRAVSTGLVGSPMLFGATAAADPNSLPLAFSGMVPGSGAAGVSVTTTILATFSRAVDPTTVDDGTFYIHKSGDVAHVPVVYGFTDGNRKVSLTPVAPLNYTTSYDVEILNGPSGVKDADGGELSSPVSETFSTQGSPPLVLASISPPGAIQGVTLTLSGSGFDPTPANNLVVFNGATAVPYTAAVDHLNVNVPSGAITGNVRVDVGGSSSNTLPFTVLVPSSSPVDEVLATVGTGTATRSVVLNPDGTLAYTVSPDADVVVPINAETQVSLPSITVGDFPISIAMHPEGTYAYVANFNSNSVSVISVHPDSADYNTVVQTIIVGNNPIDVAIDSDGDRLIVANSGANTLSIVDTDEQSANYNTVLATVGTGTSTKSVALAPDGSRIYIGTDTGYIVMDGSNYGVLSTVGTGTATKSVTLSPDGSMLIILATNGTVLIYNVDPNAGSNENTVLATVGTGTSTTSVTLSPDGSLLYLVQSDVNQVVVIALSVVGSVSVMDPEVQIPPFRVVATAVDTILTGEEPTSIAFDPSGSGLAVITNAGDSTITFLDVYGTLTGPIEASAVVTPRTLNLSSRGRWVTGSIELPIAFAPQEIVLSTVRLQDTIPPEPDKWEIVDKDLDGIDELIVKFDRAAFQEIMPEGDYVPVTITGIVRGLQFLGEDTIRTIRPTVTHPTGGVVAPGSQVNVTWVSPEGYAVDSVDVYWTPNDGRNWLGIVSGIPDVGHTPWTAPGEIYDSCRVMVTLYAEGTDLGMGMSPEMFLIAEPVAINLESFEGAIEDGAAVLTWITSRERSVRGFHLLRSEDEKGLYSRITKRQLPASGKLTGSSYRYTDVDVHPNRTYYYKLEEVSEHGENLLFGPYKVAYIAKFSLEQNVPNPFNPATTIRFTLPEDQHVKLVIYDVSGRMVRILLDEKKHADNYKILWNGRDEKGQPVASGIYFYRLRAGKHSATRKMVLLK